MKIPSIDEIILQLRDFNNDDLTLYSAIVKESFEDVEPVFTKPKYVDFYWHCASTVPGWIFDVVASNALAESQGSERLIALWRSTRCKKEIEDRILFHAKDESRHSHLFVKLLSLASPESHFHEELKGLRDQLTTIKAQDLKKEEACITDKTLIDYLMQINMAEIRTLIHMHFIGPVIYSLAPPENKEKAFLVLQGLANDEIVHIGYTSRLIQEWCKDKNYALAKQIYHKRLRFFHEFTVSQTECAIRSYGKNLFPELLQI